MISALTHRNLYCTDIFSRFVRVPLDDLSLRISEWKWIRGTWLTSLVSAQGSDLLYYYIIFNLIAMNNVTILYHGIRKTILSGIHIILTCL